MQDARAAPPVYDDLHNCVGWPPSYSSSTVFGSSACYTMRSMRLERNVHSLSPEARVFLKPSLRTVDSLFYTGENSSTVVQSAQSTEPPPDTDVSPEPDDDVPSEQPPPYYDSDAFIDDTDDEGDEDGVKEHKDEENNMLTAKNNMLKMLRADLTVAPSHHFIGRFRSM